MDKLGLFHMDLTLERMVQFWEARKVPDFPVVHVVGTNGKGSTSAFLGSIARAHGVKVGMFTSPHFVSPRERVQVNRMPLSPQMWVELGNEVLATPGGDELTYFEFQTCLAMLGFERRKVDIAVMEAGMGGKYDATNVFDPRLTLFTPIGMDHEKVLGNTLSDIAADKAGAMHAKAVAITGPQKNEAMVRLQIHSDVVNARLMYAVDMADPVSDIKLGLAGIHQCVNARLALAGWRWYAADAGQKSDPQAERFGLESAFMPGRMQAIVLNGQRFILDGAHNGHALEALEAALKAADIQPSAVVFACLADKDCTSMVPSLRRLTEGEILVPAMQSERASDNRVVADMLGDQGRPVPSLEAALQECVDLPGPILVCGSLYLLAEVYDKYPEYLNPSQGGS